MPDYIESYTKNNFFCKKCKLCENTTHPFIEGRGNIDAKVLILTDHPTKNDETLGTAYGGMFGKSIEREVIQAGIRSYYLSYMVKCYPNEKKVATAKKYCYPFTIALIKKMKPHVIVAMGRDVLESLIKISIDPDVTRGKQFYHPELKTIIIPTYNPRIFLNDKTDPLYRVNFKEDLKLAAICASSPHPRPLIAKPRSLKDPVEIEAYLNELLIAPEFAFDIETAKLESVEEQDDLRHSDDDDSEYHEEVVVDPESIEAAVESEPETKETEDEDYIPDSKNKKKRDASHSPRRDRITDISFCMKPGFGVHILWEDLSPYMDLVRQVFAGPAKKYGHNGRYDREFLECIGIPVENYSFDTMIAYHRLTMSYEGAKAKNLYKLKTMDWFLTSAGGYNEVLDEFGGIKGLQDKKPKKVKKPKKGESPVLTAEEMTPEEAMVEALNKFLMDSSNYVLDIKKKEMAKHNLTAMEYYSAMDSDVTLRIQKRLSPDIDRLCSEFFYSIDMPVDEVFKDMELTGVLLDTHYMAKIYNENVIKAEEAKNKFFEIAGGEINMASPKQLQEVVFKKLKVTPDPKFKNKKTGSHSLDEKALTAYAAKVPELNLILDYRGYLKENSTYIAGFKDCIDPSTGRAHPSFMQIATATARIGVLSPALQTMPRDNRLRNMVIPRPGHKFVTADLSQAELRVMAQLSGDEAMIDAFIGGFDLHAYTACKALLHIPLEQYDDKNPEHKKARTGSKSINFGIIYLIGPKKLAEQIGVTPAEAQQYIEAWFGMYPKVYTWIENTKRFAIEHGYTETLYGRRRHLPDIKSPDDFIREAAIRRAVNTPIQSSANDIAFMALIRMNKYIKEHGLGAKIILVVHDEIIIETPEHEVDIVQSKLVEFMTKDIPKMDKVPLVADPSVLDRWEK